MKPFLQLNLQVGNEKAEAPNLPSPERDEPRPDVPPSKNLNQIANRAAHKAALEYNRGGAGIFSK